MTVIEMTHSFLMKAKTLDRIDVQNMKTFEILRYMNDTQNIVVDELVASNRFDLLHTITDSDSIASASFATYDNTPSGGIVVDLSGLTGFRNYVRSESNITRSAVPIVTTTNFANITTPKEDIGIFETNGINKPIFTNPRCFVEGLCLIVVPDGYSTIISEKITFVRIPDTLVMTGAGAGEATVSELPTFLHEKIVDLAVQKSQETININDVKK